MNYALSVPDTTSELNFVVQGRMLLALPSDSNEIYVAPINNEAAEDVENAIAVGYHSQNEIPFVHDVSLLGFEILTRKINQKQEANMHSPISLMDVDFQIKTITDNVRRKTKTPTVTFTRIWPLALYDRPSGQKRPRDTDVSPRAY